MIAEEYLLQVMASTLKFLNFQTMVRVTCALSITFGLCYFISALLQEKSAEEAIKLGVFCFLRGILGGILGSIIGMILCLIVYKLTAGEPDFISYDIFAMMYGATAFIVCWLFGVFVGSFSEKII